MKQWDYRFGGTGDEYLSCFIETSDLGYMIGGDSWSDISGDKTQSSWGESDFWVVKIDGVGIMQWNRRFGGTNYDELFAIQQTSDGGYILGGFSSSDSSGDKTEHSWGNWDYWIVKIDELGNKQWDKRFGGSSDDELYSLEQTSDGGYILGGSSNSPISGDKTQDAWGSSDYWIIKTDSLGNKVWDKRLGGGDYEQLSYIHQTNDGGFILGGISSSLIDGDKTESSWGYQDYWIVKTDSVGNQLWDKDFGGTGNDQLYSLNLTSDYGYILGGLSQSNISGDKTQPVWGPVSDVDYWLIKIDSIGTKQWDKDFGGTEYDDFFGTISSTLDGGYLIAGWSKSDSSGNKTENNLGAIQSWVIKIDSYGNKIWDKTLFAIGNDNGGYALQDNDGCYVIATPTNADVGGYKTQHNWDPSFNTGDYWIVKFCDTTGSYLLPHSFFSSIDTTICEKFCINFLDQSNNNPTAWQWQFPGGNPSSSTLQNPTNICYNIPGTYDVTLITTNANGSDTLTLHNYITVYPIPPIPTITQVGYTLTSSPASSYQWQLNAVDIPGATNQSYTILQTGYYTVVVGDSNSCKNSASVYILISGVDEVSGDAGISIYPNPSSGSFKIELLQPENSGEVLIDVINTLGQKVFSSQQSRSIRTSPDFKKEIDLTKEAQGVYFLKIKTKTVFATKKIIITK